MAYPRDQSLPTLALFRALLQAYPDWTHGYPLSQSTQLKSGTLYPILKRLHDRNLLEARWEPPVIEGRPPRHAYRLTDVGRTVARERTEKSATPLKAGVLT